MLVPYCRVGRRFPRSERGGLEFWAERGLAFWCCWRRDVDRRPREDLELYYALRARNCDPVWSIRVRIPCDEREH